VQFCPFSYTCYHPNPIDNPNCRHMTCNAYVLSVPSYFREIAAWRTRLLQEICGTGRRNVQFNYIWFSEGREREGKERKEHGKRGGYPLLSDFLATPMLDKKINHNYGRHAQQMRTLYFGPVSVFFFSSADLSSCRLDVYHTSTHGVALVQI